MKKGRIRPASLADLKALLAIEDGWETTPGWNRGHFESELSSEKSVLFVIEDDEGVAGYAGFWKIPPEAQVTTVAVHPRKARSGFGGRLFRHLIDAVRAEGLNLITLEVSAENEPALRLYRAAGFKVVGRRAKFYNDASDAILMDLSLT